MLCPGMGRARGEPPIPCRLLWAILNFFVCLTNSVRSRVWSLIFMCLTRYKLFPCHCLSVFLFPGDSLVYNKQGALTLLSYSLVGVLFWGLCLSAFTDRGNKLNWTVQFWKPTKRLMAAVVCPQGCSRRVRREEGIPPSSGELVPALGRGRTSFVCRVCQQQRLKPSHPGLEKSGCQTSGSIEVWSGCQ